MSDYKQSTEYDNAVLEAMLTAQRESSQHLADVLAAAHLNAVRDLLSEFRPKKVYQRLRIDSAAYTVPVVMRVPFLRLGGLWVHNPTTTIVHVFVGFNDTSGISDFDVAPNRYVSMPYNTWDDHQLVTVKLDAQSVGIVRIIASSEAIGPAEGTI